LLWLFGEAGAIDIFSHVGLVLALVGGVVATFGRDLAKAWRLPLGLLFFMVPAGAEITPLLQNATALAVTAALNLTGVETARDGFILTTEAGRFEVAESCAGLRFLIASAMIALVVSNFAFATWRKRAAFVAAALVAAVVANWLRAYAIVLVATATERRIGVGPEHVALGWVLYCLLICGVILLARRFADGFIALAAPSSRMAAPPQEFGAWILPTAITLPLAALAYTNVAFNRNDDMTTRNHLAQTASTSLWTAYAPNADAVSTIAYSGVIVSGASFLDDRRGAEIVGTETRAADGEIWRRVAVARRKIVVDDRPQSVSIETIANSQGEKLDVATFYLVGAKIRFSPISTKFDVALRKVAGHRVAGAAYFIAAPSPGDAALATYFAAFDAAREAAP
jgi:exosortase